MEPAYQASHFTAALSFPFCQYQHHKHPVAIFVFTGRECWGAADLFVTLDERHNRSVSFVYNEILILFIISYWRMLFEIYQLVFNPFYSIGLLTSMALRVYHVVIWLKTKSSTIQFSSLVPFSITWILIFFFSSLDFYYTTACFFTFFSWL